MCCTVLLGYKHLDHQMYFCIMNENFGKSAKNKKFIELEVFNDESIERF